MGGKCIHCGGPVDWKNEAGHYRDFCEECVNDHPEHNPRARFDPDGEPEEPDRPWRADG